MRKTNDDEIKVWFRRLHPDAKFNPPPWVSGCFLPFQIRPNRNIVRLETRLATRLETCIYETFLRLQAKSDHNWFPNVTLLSWVECKTKTMSSKPGIGVKWAKSMLPVLHNWQTSPHHAGIKPFTQVARSHNSYLLTWHGLHEGGAVEWNLCPNGKRFGVNYALVHSVYYSSLCLLWTLFLLTWRYCTSAQKLNIISAEHLNVPV